MSDGLQLDNQMPRSYNIIGLKFSHFFYFRGKKGSYLPLHVNHFQQSLEKLLDDSEIFETPESNHHDFSGSTNSISISPRSLTTFQTDQEPLSPVFNSVIEAELAEYASAGVLGKYNFLSNQSYFFCNNRVLKNVRNSPAFRSRSGYNRK